LKKFTLKVEVFTDSNATKPAWHVMEQVVEACARNKLIDHKVRVTSCEDITEQGYKVWRGRVKGETQKAVTAAARASQRYLEGQTSFDFSK
jgi:hypothetical protein